MGGERCGLRSNFTYIDTCKLCFFSSSKAKGGRLKSEGGGRVGKGSMGRGRGRGRGEGKKRGKGGHRPQDYTLVERKLCCQSDKFHFPG